MREITWKVDARKFPLTTQLNSASFLHKNNTKFQSFQLFLQPHHRYNKIHGSVISVMDFGGPMMTRLVGDYILGPRIGSGSFAVVRRSRHRHSGLEVAVKEIDKTQLSPKVRDNLIKEISILSTVDHPNIIRLFEAIEV